MSRSLCLPPARTHFCEDTAVLYGRVSNPVKTFLNGTMPALTNISVGSFCGTKGAEGTMRCPLPPKYSRNERRRSLVEVVLVELMAG